MKDLKSFSVFLRTKCLRELAIEYLDIINSLNIPLIKLVTERNIFPGLNEEKGIEMAMQGLERFLNSIETDTLFENTKKSLKQWEENKIPVPGFTREDIHPSDLVLIYAAQKKAILKFLPSFCISAAEASAVISELEDCYTNTQNEAVQTLFRIQKNTESKLNETEEKFGAIFESAPDAIIISDKDGIIHQINSQTVRLFGYLKQELIGKKVETLIPERFQSSHPKHRENYTHQPKFRRMGIGLELLGRKQDGTEFPVEISLSPLKTSDGMFISAAVRDVTERQKAENKLKESEEKYRRLVQVVKDYAIFMLDDKGNIKSWNEGAETIHGYKAEEVLGKHYSIFYREADIKKEVPGQNLKSAIENGHYETESERIRKDGSLFWANVTITPVYSVNGELTGFSKVTRDITERKRIEESRQRLITMLEATHDFVGIADAKSRNLQYINTAGRKMTGLTNKDDISKLKINNVLAEWTNKLLEETAIPAAIKDGIWEGECAFLNHVTGQEVPVSMVLLSHKDYNGRVVRFSTISRDITRQKFAEEELRSVNNFLNSILENLPSMVFVKDAENLRFVRFNHAGEDLLGFSMKDLLGKNDYDFFPKEQADFFTEKDKAVLSQKNIIDVPEEPIDTKKGQRWLHTRKIPIFNQNGKPAYLLGISEDITEIRKAKVELEEKSRELERSNKELEQFAYVASHDLQEPLRTVSSYVQLLANRYKGKLDKDADEFMHYAVDGNNRMRALINSLLEYSRINRVKPFERINTESVIADILTDISEQIKATGAVIKYDKLPEITGDAVLIGQLFLNLIVNALKFRSDKKPEIIISGKKRNEDYLFSVKDNGIGIQKDYWDKIFVIFQRLNNREQYPGTGIGLSICKKIVERHGGKIWVESEPGEGSTFFFTIKKPESKPLSEKIKENGKQDKHTVN